MSVCSLSFSLPQGLVTPEGLVYREGVMRLTTGEDELAVQGDGRSHNNPAYTVLIMLSRVIVALGSLSTITPALLEGLFLSDLNYLLDLYNQMNPEEAALSLLGEIGATLRNNCFER